MTSVPSVMMRRYIDTPALKKFFKAADDIVDIGEYFISNKMKELKEMTEKGIEPSDEGKEFIPGVSCRGMGEIESLRSMFDVLTSELEDDSPCKLQNKIQLLHQVSHTNPLNTGKKAICTNLQPSNSIM